MKKTIGVAMLTMFLMSMLLAGAAIAKPVELIWYTVGGPGWPYKDAEQVYAKLNAILEEEVGATITFKIPGGFGDYRQKMPVTMGAGEYFDLVWTSHWCNDYLSAVNNELYAPLNELLPKYAPFIWENTKDILPALAVKGNIYGVPHQALLAKSSNVKVWESHKEKYGWDMSAIKELKDIEPLLADIKANEPELLPLSARKPPAMWAKFSLGYTGIGVFEEQFLAVRIDDEQCQVFNMLEDPAYVENLKLTRDWYNKGYIAKDGLTYSQDQWNQLVNNGKIAIDLHNTWVPGGNIREMPFGEDQGAYRFGKVFVEGASVTSTVTAISAQSKHKEKAIEVMEYLWTHPDAFNLLGFGIEGQHYEKVDDNVIKVDTGSGYYTATSWLYGNEAIIGAYIQYPSPPDRNRLIMEYTEKAAVPPIMGFVLDMEEIKPLVASINAVVDQYHMPVGGGYVDLETELPKYLDALKQAGADELIVKIQAQIDAWLASK